jgi:hypothetical protein
MPPFEEGLSKHLYLKHMIKVIKDKIVLPCLQSRPTTPQSTNLPPQAPIVHHSVNIKNQMPQPSVQIQARTNFESPYLKASNLEKLSERSIFNNQARHSTIIRQEERFSGIQSNQNQRSAKKSLTPEKRVSKELPGQLIRPKDSSPMRSPVKSPARTVHGIPLSANKSPLPTQYGKIKNLSQIKKQGANARAEFISDSFTAFNFEDEKPEASSMALFNVPLKKGQAVVSSKLPNSIKAKTSQFSSFGLGSFRQSKSPYK